SLGNYVGVGEPAYEMFAKTMSIPDDLMREWFELLTDRSAEEIAALTDAKKTHPMDAKKTLGKDIVGFYHGAAGAEQAAEEWARRFQQRQDRADIRAQPISRGELVGGQVPICKLLVLLGMAKSNNEARRLVEGGAVSIGPERTKVSDPKANIAVSDGLI